MRKKTFSGVLASRWRRQLAASAARSNDTTRTLKFPLDLSTDISAPNTDAWAGFADLHRVIASDAQSSLIRFIYDLLLCGFRILSKEADTEAFRNASVLDDAGWRESVCTGSGLTVAAASFVPSEIYKRLLIAPRAVGGKDSGFKGEVIATEYAKFFCGGKHGDKIPGPERELFDAIGRSLVKAFGSWKEVAVDPAAAAGVIDDVIAQLGYATPARSLGTRIGALRPINPPGTLAYDPAAPKFDQSAGIEPHLIVARALLVGRAEGLHIKQELTKYAQAFFTGDANHGGLSWLFGKGLEYFRNNSAEEIAAAFDLPGARMPEIRRLRESALNIPKAGDTILGGKSYSPYRSGIGGTLGSWVANYINRLFSLDKALSADAEPLVLPAPLLADVHLFEKIGIRPEEIDVMCRQALADRAGASRALDKLIGSVAGACAGDVAIIENYSTLLDTLAGLLGQVKEATAAAVAIAEATHDKAAQEHLKGYTFESPKWIMRLEKVNRLDLAPASPERELHVAAEEFGLLHEAMHAHYADILAWAQRSGETLSPLQRLSALEAQYAREDKKKRNPEEQAFRNCINRLGRAARKCSEPMLRAVAEFFAQENVFAERAHLNLFFFNRRGALYKSAFDRNPRQPFPVRHDAVQAAPEILARFARFLAAQRKTIIGAPGISLIAVSDLFRMERAHFGVLLLGFPDDLPTELALHDAVKGVFNLPLPVRLRLAGPKVTSSVMRKIFNHYYIRLESLAAVLLRERFFQRSKFQRAGECALLYAPADASWPAPARLYASGKPIGDAMRRIERADGGQVPVDPPLALAHLLDTYEDTADAGLRAYLRQAPHDWFVPWPDGAQVRSILIDKKGCGKRLAAEPVVRLIGSPAYKGVLDRMLTAPDEISIGDYALIIDRHYSQTARRLPDGRIEALASPLRLEACVALPVSETRLEPAPFPFKNYVAIDLGERGIGYAVFDAATHNLIEKGRVKVKSMHALVMDDRAGRRKTSRAMRFGAGFDPAEERRRENVVGDFCHAINRLMWYYNAFPVLEYAAGGASSTIDKVYKAVADRYLFSATATVNSERESYWKGASFWKHPHLTQLQFDEAAGKKGNKIVLLSLFPGAGTSAYGTSQACSCCGRNPVEAARELINGDRKASIEVRPGGVVALGNGTINLHLAAQGAAREAARRGNRATPMTTLLPTGTISGDELLRLIVRNLRQPPPSRQARDTRQSVYHCLYEDCGEVMHADENASVNIGRKWAAERPIPA